MKNNYRLKSTDLATALKNLPSAPTDMSCPVHRVQLIAPGPVEVEAPVIDKKNMMEKPCLEFTWDFESQDWYLSKIYNAAK